VYKILLDVTPNYRSIDVMELNDSGSRRQRLYLVKHLSDSELETTGHEKLHRAVGTAACTCKKKEDLTTFPTM
jgi:hypothetical protein